MKLETMVRIVAVIKYFLDVVLIIGCGVLTHWISCVVLKMPAFTGNAFGLAVFAVCSVGTFWTIEFFLNFNEKSKFIVDEIEKELELEKTTTTSKLEQENLEI